MTNQINRLVLTPRAFTSEEIPRPDPFSDPNPRFAPDPEEPGRPPATIRPATTSSLMVVEIINEVRAEKGVKPLLHKDFLKKFEGHPGITSAKFFAYVDLPGPNGAVRKSKIYNMPMREAHLMVMSESLEIQAKVYDRLVELETKLKLESTPPQALERLPDSDTDVYKLTHKLFATRIVQVTSAKYRKRLKADWEHAHGVPLPDDVVIEFNNLEFYLKHALKFFDMSGGEAGHIARLAVGAPAPSQRPQILLK